MKTEVTELLGIEYPIIQGGMAWVAEYHLAAAVSAAGGLGLIGAASAPADWVRQQVREVKKLTDKPFGVNIMLMSPYADEIAQVIVEEKVPVVTTGAGNPEKYMKMWKEAGVKIIPVIASVAHAKRMERCGADAVVAEGCESGGHIGDLLQVSEKIQRWFLFHKLRMQFRFRLLQLVESQTEEGLQQPSCLVQKPFRWELILWQPQSAGHIRITKI